MKVKIPIYLILILAPFYPWLGYAISNVNTILGALVGGTKDLLIITTILIALVSLVARNRYYAMSIPRQGILLYFWFFYVSLHIIGLVYYYSPLLIVDGLRYLWLYCLLGVIVLVAFNQDDINLDFVQKVITIQFIIVLIWGGIEYLNPNITVTMYGLNERADMYYAKYGPKDRIIASFINPIIYGAFLCLGVSCYFIRILKSNIKFKWIIFWTIAFLGFGICILTLSRLATICYFLVLIHLILINVKSRVFTSFYIFSAVMAFSLPYVISILDNFTVLSSRLVGLFDVETYTGNLRVTRMEGNISSHFSYVTDVLWGLGIGSSFPGAMVGVENSIATVFVELGLLGLTCYILIVVHGLLLLFLSKNLSSNDKMFFYFVFFVSLVMGIGNDFVKIFPFSFYFWFFYAYLIIYERKKC